ncbi:MAG: peptidoglycan DD-metalloendopeptidase family protein [Nitrospiraceae bacterium]|nr:MAG: peptidoglycan DD-metalloendopeptidase family protein [Nitrospiraceae bacterium]
MRLMFIIIPAALVVAYMMFSPGAQSSKPLDPPAVSPEPEKRENIISGIVRPSDTLELIFDRHGLDKSDMYSIIRDTRGMYNLSRIAVGNVYTFDLDQDDKTVLRMRYGIDDLSYLDVSRREDRFEAETVSLPVERRTSSLYILIRENLISSMPGSHVEYLKIALALSDIYAWDIDFSHDIRNGDEVKLIIEELWVGDVFRGYGDILAAAFINDGESRYAFRFEDDGQADYYDERGNSLRKALLRSPLRFRYISSGFTKNRLHPRLRIYRPHLGVDYAAPTGTPVSAAGNGTVEFAGFKGQMGRMVKIRHPGNYETYYGHLSRIPKGIRRGTKVSQGNTVGYVGSSGLSTGPHLDYRIRYNGKFVNPLTIRLPRGTPVRHGAIARFREVVQGLEARIDTISVPVVVCREEDRSPC